MWKFTSIRQRHLRMVASRCGPWKALGNHQKKIILLNYPILSSQMLINPVTQLHHMHQTARYSCSSVVVLICSRSGFVAVYACVAKHPHSYAVLPGQCGILVFLLFHWQSVLYNNVIELHKSIVHRWLSMNIHKKVPELYSSPAQLRKTMV